MLIVVNMSRNTLEWDKFAALDYAITLAWLGREGLIVAAQ